jgi:hypothetical protein
MMNFAGKTCNIKALQKKDPGSKKEKGKKKWGLADKTIFTALGGLAVIEGINLAGRFGKRKGIAYKAIGRVFKGINKKLKTGEKINGFAAPLVGKVRKGNGFKKFTDLMAKQANVSDKWLERSVVFNLISRLAINLPTGNYYNATRDSVDQVMQLALMGAAGKTIVNPAKKGLAKRLGVPAYNKGVKVIADHGIKNVVIVCGLMGLLNNAISHRALNCLKKIGIGKGNTPEKDNDYKDFRKRFVPALSLKYSKPFFANVNEVNKILFQS